MYNYGTENHMETTLSTAAILIALLSLGVSAYMAWLDHPRLLTESKVFKHEETDEYSVLYVKAVNIGRRPIILRWLRGNYEENEQSGISVGDKGQVKLEEGEFHEERIGKFDGMMMYSGQFGEKDCQLIELFFEDSRGKRHPIKNSKENIAKLWASKHPLGIRTHSNAA